ncbi:ATP synthase F0F1 subunit alpha [Methylocaldum marinum]|uniref:ATP synthase subunit alpha n=1 Tax=Methylocaldum marinum TaxID=1432792 RepID=A0A250KPN8_9GAMM|nr:F0F1 ATP synthase subunit alpha [Methylocaldum marinum]BBA33537.1 ATP synthase F0F1 subunit alpha [Methylocaldum marinum]
MPFHATPRNGSSLARLGEQVEHYRFGLRLEEYGKVLSVGDGIAWIRGLPSAAMDELLMFGDGSRGLVFHLGNQRLGAILLEQTVGLASGSPVYLTGQRLALSVGDGLAGRVIDPLGKPLDGGPAPELALRRELDVSSPPIVARDFVDRPLYTGTKIVDAMIPLGRGQRQLIIGDNGVGKTSLALDVVLNQRDRDVLCVYVLIGQKRSDTISVIDLLRRYGALAYTTVVVAEASDSPGLKYLAPFAGCAVAEYWMWHGRDTLIVYDDLSTHARAYRELSLLLRRPPGREAYPGDIFFLHSRLLERSTCLAASHGGGSMTALPIVETEQGEIAAYIPTNLISITDGQIYLDRRLFGSGFLPAIDITRSVSRIGGRAQHPRIKEEAARMKLDFLQFLELETFTRFGSKLEASMEQKIRRGQVLREILKQERLVPLSPEFQLAWMVAYNTGRFDDPDPATIRQQLDVLAKGLERFPIDLSASREEWNQWLDRRLSGIGRHGG